MKKITTILLLFIAIFAGCTKENCTPEQSEVEVSFVFNNISETGNIQTRSFSDKVLPNLSYEYPKIVYLGENYTLDFSKTNKYSVQPGSYFVCSRKGDKRSLDSKFYAKTKVPLEIHDTYISDMNYQTSIGYRVQVGDSQYCTLEVRFGAIVIACKEEDVSYFKWRTDCQTWNSTNILHSNGYYYYILTVPDSLVLGGDEYFQDLTVEMGETEKNETTQVSIRIKKSSRGKYYVFSPNEKNCTVFSMENIQEWENGSE